ncbi:MAG TPA: hypothetical protein VFZ67_01775, partial [Nitrososphaera sp.]
LGLPARNSLQSSADFPVKYDGADDSMYMKQDFQATENNHTRLLPFSLIATLAIEQLTITILTHWKEIRT